MRQGLQNNLANRSIGSPPYNLGHIDKQLNTTGGFGEIIDGDDLFYSMKDAKGIRNIGGKRPSDSNVSAMPKQI